MALVDYKYNGRNDKPFDMAVEAIRGSVVIDDAVVIGVYGPQQALWEVLRDLAHDSDHLAHECAVFEGEENGRLWKVLVGPIDSLGEVNLRRP